MLTGWPQPIHRTANGIKQNVQLQTKQTMQQLKADLQGFVVRMRIKKDVSTLKLLGLKFQNREGPEINSLLKFSLDDLQVMHQNNELVFKHNLIGEYLSSDEQILAEEDFHILNIEVE